MAIGSVFVRHLILTLFAALLFIPFLGGVHLFDWDEINFAEAAREMLVSGDWSMVQINFEPFWEKPPLFFWLQAASMKLFGINEFAARLPNAICGIATLNLLYFIGSNHVSDKFAFWWVLCFVGSFTPFLYFKSGIIDPWFNLFIFSSLYPVYLASLSSNHRIQLWFWAGILLGLAVLTKGPVAIIIVGFCVIIFWMMNHFKPFFGLISILVFVFALLLIPALWFLPETLKNGPWFIKAFLSYQTDLLLNPVASHGQPWFYHPLVLLVGCFPASIFAFSKFTSQRGYAREQASLKKMMGILFWVVLILFSAVTTKIVHYSSLCYVPLSFLAALAIYDSRGSFSKNALTRFQKFFLIVLAFLWFAVLTIIPLIAINDKLKAWVISLIRDPFVVENIKVASNWNGWEWAVGVVHLSLWVWFFFSYKRIRGQGSGKKYMLNSFAVLLYSHTILAFAILAVLFPKIEGHTQRAAIEFYFKHQNENAVFVTHKFKSYAPLFYGKVKMGQYDSGSIAERMKILKSLNCKSLTDLSTNQKEDFEKRFSHWLTDSSSTQKVYIVSLMNKADELRQKNHLELLYEKGGYVFFRKKQTTISNPMKPVR